jgi:hypothetical protein
MSFLGEPFKHDLFVSYSHGAFRGQHDSDLKRWSKRFADDLRAELAGTVEFEETLVFLDESDRADESVDRTEALTCQLRDLVEGSALFAPLMTPHYLRSRWCRQELNWWCEKHHPNTLGAGGRIFICRVRPSDEGAWPPPLKDIVGYFCYDRDLEADKARPFTWRDSKRDVDDYNDLLVQLAGDVMQRLRAIGTALEQERQRKLDAARRAADGGQVIYLHAREEQGEAWQRAGDALGQEDFVVLPTEPDPIVREPEVIREIDARRIDIMSGCDGLLLLGTQDGRALDADLVVVGRKDRQSARSRTEKLLPCAVLDTAGLATTIPKHKATARTLGIEWIDAVGGPWPNEVKRWLNGASE